MEYQKLGPFTVSKVALGTAALGGAPYAGTMVDDPRAVIKAALDAGITLFETAPTYGRAEDALRESGAADCVVITKVSATVNELDAYDSLQRSRTRLGRRKSLDIVLLHNPTVLDFNSSALSMLHYWKQQGDVVLIGASVYTEAEALSAIAAGLDVVELPYSLLDRRPERRVFKAARQANVALLARSVFLRGALTPYHVLGEACAMSGALKAANDLRRRLVTTWADLPELAVRFAAHQSAIASAIVGSRSAEEVADAAAACDIGQLPWWRRALLETLPHAPDDIVDPRRWPYERR